MNQHIIASVRTALVDGQLADDAALVRDRAIDWGHAEMADTYHAQWLRLTGCLHEDAVAEATQAGVELDLR